MRKLGIAFSILWLPMVFVIAAYPASYLAAPQPASEQAKDTMAKGELVKVDTANQTFTIKLANDEELQFQYDSDTKVEGSENGIQGLSADSGTHVAVYYTEKEGRKLATRIEIGEKQ